MCGRAGLRLRDGCQLCSDLLDVRADLLDVRRHDLPHCLSARADRGLYASNIG